MFIRKGMDIRISKVYDSFASCKEDWGGFNRSAHISSKEFEYDPDNFLYYRARAITADVSNSNGDYFPLKEIKAAYDTFIGKAVYLNHDNDDPSKAFGLVLDAEMVETPTAERSHGTGYVEILAAVDKELAEELHPGLLRRIQSGIINSTSMSCFASEASCCICNNMAHSPQELCCMPDTLITTADGAVKPIQDIKIGDSVLDADGSYKPVTQIFCRRVTDEQIYNLKISGNNEKLSVTANHPVLTLKNVGNASRTILLPKKYHSALCLKKDDFIIRPGVSLNVYSSLSLDLLRFLGYYASEGSIGYQPRKAGRIAYGVEFSFNIKEKAYVKDVCDLATKLFNVSPKVYQYSESKACSVRIHSPQAAELCIKHCGTLAKEKVLSTEIMQAPIEGQKHFLGAYINGDGTFRHRSRHGSQGEVAMTTASRGLAYQLQYLLLRCGMRGRIYKKSNGSSNELRKRMQNKPPLAKDVQFSCWDIVLTSSDRAMLLGYSDKVTTDATVTTPETLNNIMFYEKNNMISRINDVEVTKYTGPVFNFEVSGSHSYVANGVAVHNCSHMNPGTFTYIKGKRVDPYDIAYEINYGITFTEDSLVDNPADSTARIFQVFASDSNKLQDVQTISALKKKLSDIIILLDVL